MIREHKVKEFTFDDMKKIGRTKLENFVPIELYRAIRLIGMNQGLPMEGAISKIKNKKVFVREVKCNVNGDDYCEYEVRF
jgi:hypothetical protein